MSKLKLAFTFGIGFIFSIITSLVFSSVVLDGITDSKVIVVVNAISMLVITALINIPVYLYILNKVKEEEL